jgi:hypothetical protein
MALVLQVAPRPLILRRWSMPGLPAPQHLLIFAMAEVSPALLGVCWGGAGGRP